MQKLTPCLWFSDNAEDALNFYVSVFPNAKIKSSHYYGEVGPGDKGTFLTGIIELFGQDFMILSSNGHFQPSEVVSFSVDCEDQAEVDYYWEKLTADGGEESMCGWLKDKFGISWQIIPRQLAECMSNPDPEKSGRAMQAMLQMKKIDIKKLEDAVNGVA